MNRIKERLLTIGLPIAGAIVLATVGIGIASAASTTGTGSNGGGAGFMGGFGGAMSAETPAVQAQNQTTLFQNEASATGLSESVIVSGWAAGQSLEQVATANGVSQTQLATDMQNYEQSQLNTELQALVTNGTITQAQMTQRLQTIQTQQAAMKANAGKIGQGFRGKGRGKTATSTPTSSSN
jgi:hypothetical protein